MWVGSSKGKNGDQNSAQMEGDGVNGDRLGGTSIISGTPLSGWLLKRKKNKEKKCCVVSFGSVALRLKLPGLAQVRRFCSLK